MLRFENEGTTISVKLPKTDYIVYMMANYSKETDTYHTKLYIVRKDVSDLVLVDDDYEMKSNFSSIRFDMGEYITEKYNKGFFDYYIDRYEYQQKCFDKGVEFVENAN